MGQHAFTDYSEATLRLALALANRTHAEVRPGVWEVEGFRSGEDLRALLEEHGWPAAHPVGASEVEQVRALRDSLRAVFEKALADPAAAATELAALVAAGRPRATLGSGEEGPRIELSADPQASLLEQLRTVLPLAVARAAERRGIDRFRRCGDAPATGNACTVVFIDRSKNGRSRFCRPQCASRTHVAAFRRRGRNADHDGAADRA